MRISMVGSTLCLTALALAIPQGALAQANLAELNSRLDEIEREMNQPATDEGKPGKRQD